MFAKILQDYLKKVQESTGITVGIADETGSILASTENVLLSAEDGLKEFLSNDFESTVCSNFYFKKVYLSNRLKYIIIVPAGSGDNDKLTALVALNILSLKAGYDDKYDKTVFVKSILLDEMIHGDVAIKAKELHISFNAPRIVYLIKANCGKDSGVYDIIQGLHPNKSKDFIIVLNKEETVLVKELKQGTDYREIEKNAGIIVDTLSTELMIRASVGIGTISNDIVGISKSFKEAGISLQVGEIFMDDRYTFSYNNLGLGRLLYALPATNCRLFLDEFFQKGNFDFGDMETMLTIQKFFENSLNISETSRQLYVHRNTLVYRLDKILKQTGLDLRKFDDAIAFKIALLVKKYLDKNENI